MLLIIESTDEQVLQTISEFAQPLNAFVRRVSNGLKISAQERKRRTAIIRRFKGRLKTAANGYVPSKHEWYQQ